MPRYYFKFADRPEVDNDEGIEFPDVATARREAMCCIGEMLREGAPRMQPDRDWQLAVTDATGAYIVRVRVDIE